MRQVATGVALLCLMACGSENKSDRSPAAPPAKATPADAAAKPAAPPAPPIAEAEVQKLIDAWLAAQNGGVFEDYRALYAPSMTGILRAGDKERKLDYAGWMKSRKRMFKGGFTVKIEDMKLRRKAARAEARFVQVFRTNSGRFSDRGPKKLVIIATPDGLRIDYEEMLESTLTTGARPLGKGTVSEVPGAVEEQYGTLVWGRGQRLGDERTAHILVLDGGEDEGEGLDSYRRTAFVLVDAATDDWDTIASIDTESDFGASVKLLVDADVDGDAIADTLLWAEENRQVSEAAAHGVQYRESYLVIASSRHAAVLRVDLTEHAEGAAAAVGETLQAACFIPGADGPTFVTVFSITDADGGHEAPTNELDNNETRVFRWQGGAWAPSPPVHGHIVARSSSWKKAGAALAKAGGNTTADIGTACRALLVTIKAETRSGNGTFAVVSGLATTADDARKAAGKAPVVTIGTVRETGWTGDRDHDIQPDYDENTQ